MSIAPNEFWSRLVQSGLADEEHCRRYAAAFAKANPKASSDQADPLAEFLVRSGVISKYQGAALIGPGDPGLRLGDFAMTSDQPVMPFAHWIPVQSLADEDGSRNGFLLRVPLSGLDETLRGWLAAHSEIHSDSLQSVELSGGAQSANAEQTVEIFSPLPDGACLVKLVQAGETLSRRKTVRVGVDLAKALQAMHTPAESGLVMAHGAVAADHVWVTPKGHAILLRDPSSPARSPRSDLTASWIAHMESPALYAAPELADPSASPTIASDIYSLGCLLFSLLMGRPAFQGEDDRELFAAHNEELPQELVQAVELASKGDPILRVLAYAMSKDPAARFDSAQAFADALERAGELAVARPRSKSRQSGSRPGSGSGGDVGADNTSPSNSTPLKEAASSENGIAQANGSAESTIAATHDGATEGVREAAAGYAVETPQKGSGSKAKKAGSKGKRSRRAKDGPIPKDSGLKDSGPRDSGFKASTPPASDTPAASSPATEDSIASEMRPITVSGERSLPAGTGSQPQDDDSSSAESGHQLRRRRKRKKNRVPILAGMMVLPLLMLGLAVALRGRGSEKPPPRPRPRPGSLSNVPRVPDSRREVVEPAGPKLVNGYEIVDSERLLWVPPYAADAGPPSLELLPPGPAGIISIPLAQLIANDSATPMLQTFEAELEPMIVSVEKRAGVRRDQIQRCTLALFPGRSGRPEVALSVQLTEAMEATDLSEKWKAFESRTPEGAVLYAGEDPKSDAYYVGDGEKGKASEDGQVTRFAVASLDRIREVAEIEGGAIPMPRNMQALWKQTHSQSDLVAVVTPNFLFADGREMLNASVPEFSGTLKQWLIPNVGALSFSLAAKDSAVYVELRELPSGGATAATLLKSFRESLGGWASWADDFILESVPDPSWRLLATRLPLMLRFVADQTRSTIDGETVVASTYLPADAGAQVALGTLLAMNTPRGGSGATIAATPTQALTVDEMLDRPMSISFLQQSLQFAVDEVVNEFKQSLPPGATMPPVRIIGGDLEKNGITQNQQIRGFEKSNVPLRQVLTDLVLGANPDKTATGPDDPKQSLVWVVYPQGKSPEETEILVTTRDAAKDTYELPSEFRTESE